ncbi:uncharacterized protein LOC131881983 [Tigriopus californicus]|uniref:uncharacterized protein LOC131881983 n=1 Tax=Tigriopus californicus TaxID=6832 RepID=UPI0027DA9A23|nr:uncharacterized protein LOC131881983 [Tigriopus californicus]
MGSLTTSAILVLITLGFELSRSELVNSTRAGKIFSPFQIVTFPNIACIGSEARNGTCFTSDECTMKGGTPSGTCAQGFGVCCTFTIGCGATTSQNCTYLTQTTTTNPAADPCIFTICKESPHICRIRLDFATFAIAGPAIGTAAAAAADDAVNALKIGDCLTDSFVLSSPGNTASPVICGFNSGQHMIVDASGSCNQAIFNFDGTASTRQFDIKVTQYACGDENGGPDGCLQYFSGNTGQLASFNFPTTDSAIADGTTHLSSQCYNICFRQEEGKCAICFNTVIMGGGVTGNQGSFGLSISPDGAAAKGTQDVGCSEDYLQIPGGSRDDTGAMFTVGVLNAFSHVRICGRFFGFVDAASIVGADNNRESICTQQRPFRIIFKTDADELLVGDAATNEQKLFPGGIIGFHLDYAQQDC